MRPLDSVNHDEELPDRIRGDVPMRRLVGRMDYERTDRKAAGRMLGKCLLTGCAVEPRASATSRV